MNKFTTVKGTRLKNNIFLPEWVPDVWSSKNRKDWKFIFLLSINEKKVYSYFLPRELENANRLANSGYALTDDWTKADIIVSDRVDWLKSFVHVNRHRLLMKKLLLHSHEPSHYMGKERTARIGAKIVHMMGSFTGDVWVSNTQYFPVDEQARLRNNRFEPVAKIDNVSIPEKLSRKIVIIASFGRRPMRGNTDSVPGMLSYKRSKIALHGNQFGILDVYGRGWPPGVSKGETYLKGRNGKMSIFSYYNFCLCFENTHVPYYVTEKIWESIMGGCLPIYMGSPWIYETFPKNSFIDYSEIKSPAKLFAFILHMKPEEWARRMNLCINVFNQVRLVADRKVDSLYDSLINRLDNIMVDGDTTMGVIKGRDERQASMKKKLA